jgi:glucose-1-phosphate cytidylyltransferase
VEISVVNQPVPSSGIKAVILCGGLGTRLREETEYRPKPLVPIGNRPILWHIMKTYAAFGVTDFILALGYKGEMIKDYFLNHELWNNDFRLHLGSKRIDSLSDSSEEANWTVTFVDTGTSTATGGRLKRLERYLRDQPRFMLTYGDGVSDVDIDALLRFHDRSGSAVTVTGVRPLARFGELVVRDNHVVRFAEKPVGGEAWINGGYFVMTPAIFGSIAGDTISLEAEPLEGMARDGQLAVYRHDGYWQCMDTFREMQLLNEQWNSGRAPWVRRWRQAA